MTSKALITLLFFTLLFRSFNATGQNVKAIGQAKLLTRLPFKILPGGVIVIQGKLEGFPDILNFIFDTGSSGISLDSTTVTHLNLTKTPSSGMLFGIGSARKISYITDRTLCLAGLNVQHLNFHVNDYELLTRANGVRIDGVIGYEFLIRYIVKINYDRNIMDIFEQGTLRYPKGGFMLRPLMHRSAILDATITDNRSCSARFFFDTGGGFSLLMSENFVSDSLLLIKGKKSVSTQTEAPGNKKLMELTVVREVKLGQYNFKNVPAYIFDDEYQVTSYPQLGGLIGNDLLRRFNLIINYQENEIHLQPNAHFHEPFDYSYTGLSIYAVSNNIIIEDVHKQSPGEIAGLKAGDVILSIDDISTRNIQDYITILQDVGRQIKMKVFRNGTVVKAYMKIGSIL